MNEPGHILQGILARASLVILRVYLGIIFLVAARPKLGGDFAPRVTGFLENVALEQGYPFYQTFLRGTVLPNVEAFAPLIAGGELLVGIALVLGLATRFAAAGALFLLLNYLLAKGALPWQPSSNDGAFAMISVALLVGAAGRTLGLDVLLAERWPRSPLW